MRRKTRKREASAARHRLRGMNMTPEQQRWCESKLGHELKYRDARGTIIDYKGDLAGWGCYFIVMFDGYTDEIARPYPPALRRRGTDDSFSVRAQRKEARK